MSTNEIKTYRKKNISIFGKPMNYNSACKLYTNTWHSYARKFNNNWFFVLYIQKAFCTFSFSTHAKKTIRMKKMSIKLMAYENIMMCGLKKGNKISNTSMWDFIFHIYIKRLRFLWLFILLLMTKVIIKSYQQHIHITFNITFILL